MESFLEGCGETPSIHSLTALRQSLIQAELALKVLDTGQHPVTPAVAQMRAAAWGFIDRAHQALACGEDLRCFRLRCQKDCSEIHQLLRREGRSIQLEEEEELAVSFLA
jgi:hypothetical protein